MKAHSSISTTRYYKSLKSVVRSVFLFSFFTASCLHALVLQNEIEQDLRMVDIPLQPQRESDNNLLDVAIIGSGQSGMTACFALQKQNILNVAIFDSAPPNQEGPWRNTARMLTLRSKKENLIGPALGIPHLTFRAWYEAQYGNWDALNKVPTFLWAEYLQWYKKVLRLPVRNGWKLLSIQDDQGIFKLCFDQNREIRARRVVLATGRPGCGGFELPSFIEQLPKSFYFHTGEQIDPRILQGKRICIIGGGASAYDIAAIALENGALKVDMLMRRAGFQNDNPFDTFCLWSAYYHLSDKERAELFQKASDAGTTPPCDSVLRISKWKNFELHPNTQIEKLHVEKAIHMQTNRGFLEADLLILATGYAKNIKAISELSQSAEHILTWGDKIQGLSSRFANLPYLGNSFQLQENKTGAAPYLSRIYCFNHGACLSHGLISGDIYLLSVGAERLAEGIAIDHFLDTTR